MISIVFALSACQSGPPREPPKAPSATPPMSGGYYKDDGPGDNPPSNLDTIPEAVPRLEPLSRFSNRPYSVFGVDYVPATTLRPYKERGIASWYGRKFHSQKTSNGEVYDMYAMTAAHPTLPLPSYARVTNVASGKSVVVRVNDRGRFTPDASSTCRMPRLTASASRKQAAARSRSKASSRAMRHHRSPWRCCRRSWSPRRRPQRRCPCGRSGGYVPARARSPTMRTRKLLLREYREPNHAPRRRSEGARGQWSVQGVGGALSDER
jgi:hypothetical protein